MFPPFQVVYLSMSEDGVRGTYCVFFFAIRRDVKEMEDFSMARQLNESMGIVISHHMWSIEVRSTMCRKVSPAEMSLVFLP